MASLDDMVTVGNSVNKNISQLILAINNFASLYNSVLAVANGGTGNSSLTANAVLTGNGTNPIVAEPFFVCTDAGNVGIGTTSPTKKLGVSTSNDDGVLVTNGTVNTIVYNTAGNISTIGTSSNHAVQLFTNNTAKVAIATDGSVGIGTTSPTAVLNLKAGTATASTAPLKFNSGINLATVEAGTVEYDGTTLYASPNTSYGRGAVPLALYSTGIGTSGITLNTDYALFPAANDTITLPIGTYFVRLRAVVTVSGSTVPSVLNLNLRGAGNAVGTFSWIGSGFVTTTAQATNNSATVTSYFQAATALGTAFTVAPSSANNPRGYYAIGTGMLKVTTAGTLIPAYQFAATLTSGTTTLYSDNSMIMVTLDTQSAAAFGPAGAGWG